MKARLQILILFLLCTQFICAQQDDGVVAFDLPIRNSLVFNRYAINPTFTFVREQNKYISFNNKRELIQFDNAPETFNGSYSGRFSENMGAGIALFQQNYGVLTTFGGVLNFAYNVKLRQDQNLTFGLNVGAYKSGINTSNTVTNFDDPSLQNVADNFLLTVNPGINFGTKFLDFGVSVNNLVLYNFETSEMVKDDPRQGIKAHVMHTGFFDGRGFFEKAKFSGILMSEFRKDETIISGLASLNIPKGIWFQVGYNNRYGVSGGLGLNVTKNIALEYNIEKAIGEMVEFGSSHEVTLAYRIITKKKYDYSGDEKVSGLFSKKRKGPVVKASEEELAGIRERAAERRAQAKLDKEAEVLAQKEAEENAIAEAKEKARLEEEAKAKQLAEQRAQQEADAKAKALAEQEAKAEAERKAKERAETRARLAAEQKAKQEVAAEAKRIADAKAKTEAEAEAKRLEELKAQQEAAEQARLAEEQRAKEAAAEQARLAEEQRAKEIAEEKAREVAEQKVQAQAEAQRLENLKEQQEAEEQKAKEVAAEQARIAEEQKAKEEAAEQARLTEAQRLADLKAKQDAEAEAQQIKAKEEAKQLAEQKAIKDAQEKQKLQAEAEAQRIADEKAQKEAEAKAKTDLIENPQDELGKSLLELSKEADSTKAAQNKLLEEFNEIVEIKNQDLKDLKEENDLSEQGIAVQPKPFKSVTAENNKLNAIKANLDNSIEERSTKIEELKTLLDERSKIKTIELDEVSMFYKKKIKTLSEDQQKAIDFKSELEGKLETIRVATEFEKRRRIKRAAYDNEEDRYTQDRAMLQNIKRTTKPVASPYTSDDFDFGEKQSDNIKILKNVKNVENGYYLIIAVHNNIQKRNEFITKVVASGRVDVDFFYDVNTSKYYIYYNKFDSINAANRVMETKGNRPYNVNMTLVKIEN